MTKEEAVDLLPKIVPWSNLDGCKHSLKTLIDYIERCESGKSYCSENGMERLKLAREMLTKRVEELSAV